MNFSSLRHFPLLRRLFFMQLGIVLLGIVLVLLASHFVERLRWRSKLEESKQSLRATLALNQESLRAWKQLNLVAPLESTIRELEKIAPASRIDVLPRSGLAVLTEEQIAVPEVDDGINPFVVRGEVVASPLRSFASRLETVLLLWIGALYLGVVVFQFYFVRRYLYAPLTRFEEALRQRTPSQALVIDHISAHGEIRRFLQAFKESHDKALSVERQDALIEVSTQLAHDIRSPLSALQVLEPAFAKLPPREAELVSTIIHRMREIAESLLGVRRKDGCLVKKIRPLLVSLLAQKRLEWSGKAIEWILVCRSEFEVRMAAHDAIELERVLSNVLNNAAEAIGDTGIVEACVRLLEARVEVAVTDTGRGMDGELLKVLGAAPVLSEKKDGNGLGVYYAKAFANKIGGTLEITSERGRGTRVALCLPVSAAPGI